VSKYSPYVAKLISERAQNVSNNIWANSGVCRYLSADKWKYGILVTVKNAAEKKGSCLVQDKIGFA
jgi:hypothetical protein